MTYGWTDGWTDGGNYAVWSKRGRRDRFKVTKPKNSQVFAKFARDGVNFKTGDLLVHIPTGEPGKMLGSRGNQILFKPDSRQRAGAIWVDKETLRFDI